MNEITPRLFVAATQQNDGKTTTSLGLFNAIKPKLGRIGFIKPVGQRFINIEGKKIDEDTFLIDETYRVQTPIEDMSPIAVEPDFTRRYIEQANSDFLVRRIQNSFDRACWEKDFAIIEGTGHAGVGSVFDLSNARVAKILKSKVLMITGGGIGRPIDEIVLNKALFDQEGVEMIGVILNKVLPEKMDYIADFARRGLGRFGIELLGVIPIEPMLATPTLSQICAEVNGSFINAKSKQRRRIERIIIGAMSSPNVIDHFQHGTLIITPGDREDVLLAAISSTSLQNTFGHDLAGVVLSGDLRPHNSIMELVKASSLPVIASPLDSYTVASKVNSMTIKTLPGDTEKIAKIQSIIEQYVNVPRILELVLGN